ncbi:MAG: hypothetical protein K2L81_04225 [Muribaculaceae bacterium]|nr:hypothetical protein [Muribaculaceae bacterium]
MKEVNNATGKASEIKVDNASRTVVEKSSGVNWATVFKSIFAIFMVIVYVGMGVLLFINFFQWDPAWSWLRWVGGGIFVLYGIWRAYRQIAGVDSQV